MSKSILTGKTFKALGAENEKLGNLDDQMNEMKSDFIEMKRTRDEAKKQLEAKFQDVYRKIQLTQDFITSEGKRINDTLLAFSSKFDNKLNSFDQKLSERIEQLQTQSDTRFSEDRTRLTNLEKGLEQEKEDRIKSINDSNKNIGDQLQKLQDGLENEKNTRERREKEIERAISDLKYKLMESLDLESQDRKSSMLKFKQEMNSNLDSQKRLSEGFHQKSVDEFNLLVDNVIKEVDNRFNHQDQIVDNLSNVVKTFQDTLKVIGSDV